MVVSLRFESLLAAGVADVGAVESESGNLRPTRL